MTYHLAHNSSALGRKSALLCHASFIKLMKSIGASMLVRSGRIPSSTILYTSN